MLWEPKNEKEKSNEWIEYIIFVITIHSRTQNQMGSYWDNDSDVLVVRFSFSLAVVNVYRVNCWYNLPHIIQFTLSPFQYAPKWTRALLSIANLIIKGTSRSLNSSIDSSFLLISHFSVRMCAHHVLCHLRRKCCHFIVEPKSTCSLVVLSRTFSISSIQQLFLFFTPSFHWNVASRSPNIRNRTNMFSV